MSNSQVFRYPGTQPFSYEEAEIFFGREETIVELQQFVQLQDISVLYSKSGLGKSSLLNAGLRPALEEIPQLRVVYIRFKAYAEEQEATPSYSTRRSIVAGQFQETYLDTIIKDEPSFWHDVKEQQIIQEKAQEFILIFDQFEELFTYPEEQIEEFKKGLAELLYSKVPQRYRDIIRQQQRDETFQLTEEQLELVYQPNTVRVIMGIRSDKMHLLNQLSDYLPTILANCFELAPLTRTQAQDAIYNPALSRLDVFDSSRFEYAPAAVEKIIHFLSNGGSKPIESFQLQIICNAIEQRVITDKLKRIEESDVGDLDSLIENYYVDQLSTIKDADQRGRAQRLIEDGLIFEAEQRRLSLYQGQIQKTYGVDETLLEKLIQSRLIRSEALPDGGAVYELSHDSLVAPVLKVKQNRKIAEEKKALEREAEDAKRREDEAKARERKTKRNFYITTGLALLAGLFLVFSVFQLREKNTAKEQLSGYIQNYSYPELDEKIKTLDHSGAFQDLLSISGYLKGDSTVVTKLLEIAYVFNETGQLDSARQVLDFLSIISNYDLSPNSYNSEEEVRKSIREVQVSERVPENFFHNRYYSTMTNPVDVNGTSVSFSRTELSVWQYNLYCLSEGLDINLTTSNWGLSGDMPVVKVDWYEAISYANWLSERMGLKPAYNIRKPAGASANVQEDTTKEQWDISWDTTASGFRLPTLIEWRLAAAYGQEFTDTLPFSISGVTELLTIPNPPDPEKVTLEDQIRYTQDAHMWYLANSKGDNLLEPHPVARKKPNELGVYDMSGNLWEWCWDEDFYEGVAEQLRVVAGGAFNYEAKDCTVHSTDNNYAYYQDRSYGNTIGIRLCRTVSE